MPPTAVEDVLWNLEDAGRRRRRGGVRSAARRGRPRADAFAERYAGKVAELDGAGLAARWTSSARSPTWRAAPATTPQLRFAADTADPANGALSQHVEERATAIETQLLFFDLEWAALDDARAEELLAAEGLDNVRHHLRTVRRYRPHLLSEPEEKLMAEKNVTGRGAWSRLFSELTSAIEVELDGEDEPVPLERRDAQPAHRPTARCARRRRRPITEALAAGPAHPRATSSTRCSRTRRWTTACAATHWISSRNLSNEASDESVRGAASAVQGHYDMPAALVSR